MQNLSQIQREVVATNKVICNNLGAESQEAITATTTDIDVDGDIVCATKECQAP